MFEQKIFPRKIYYRVYAGISHNTHYFQFSFDVFSPFQQNSHYYIAHNDFITYQVTEKKLKSQPLPTMYAIESHFP